MEMQCTEWDEGEKTKTKENIGNDKPETDRQTDGQTDRDGLQRALSQCNS